MGNESTDRQRISQSFNTLWPNTSVITNFSIDQWTHTSLPKNSMKKEPVTSKYEIILQALSGQKNVNKSRRYNNGRQENQTKLGEIEQSQKWVALVLPLAIMGVFLAFVVICHRFDTIRNRRGQKKPKGKTPRTQRSSETEQAVEEVDHEADMVLLKERHKGMAYKLEKHNPIACEDIGQNGVGRCMCKLERCAHCLGIEAKKLQWKDLVYQADIRRFNTFDFKNASTQTRMPMFTRFRALPQSSHKDNSIPQRIAGANRHYVVEPDSVFDSEVSSKPHFPSSESNYTDSKASDFLSSIRASGSFYYSATNAQDSTLSAEKNEAERIDRRQQKQKGLKKNHVGEAQLLSDDENWI